MKKHGVAEEGGNKRGSLGAVPDSSPPHSFLGEEGGAHSLGLGRIYSWCRDGVPTQKPGAGAHSTCVWLM